MNLPPITDKRWSLPIAAIAVLYAGVLLAKGDKILNAFESLGLNFDSELIILTGWLMWLLSANILHVRSREELTGRILVILGHCVGLVVLAYSFDRDEAGFLASMFWGFIILAYAFIFSFSSERKISLHVFSIFLIFTPMLIGATLGEALNIYYQTRPDLVSVRLLSPADANAFACLVTVTLLSSYRSVEFNLLKAPKWLLYASLMMVLLVGWFDAGTYITRLGFLNSLGSSIIGTIFYFSYPVTIAILALSAINSKRSLRAVTLLLSGFLAGVLHGSFIYTVRIGAGVPGDWFAQAVTVGAMSGFVCAMSILLSLRLIRKLSPNNVMQPTVDGAE
ncbi:hypothetical protein [Aliikangiella coralliicola]|uniref:Uncharacterized protein n=1 Tax=Aliikangiella coralliicola TaxID=2592383 RepID=A0A545UFS8_9GAMM|nr:hypothetical protein [Aliikangiella coralliicola]TQV88243.1 hypothetical protein FLL46_06875 [Aliikangiella coralliicola]